MKFKIKKLIIQTKRDPVEIDFTSINCFYGQISSGKSTIGRLIMFCLGKNIEYTVALQREFISARLNLEIEDFDIVIERTKTDSKDLIVSYRKKDENELNHLIVPRDSKKTDSILIPNTEIQNISDLLFYFSGQKPPRVLKNKYSEDSDLVRLSFRDILWYCYLPQEEMDSSFFYLLPQDDFSKLPKSRDVMRMVLGFYREEVSQLEKVLVDTKQQKLTLEKSHEQITNLIKEYDVGTTDQIIKNKSNLQNQLEKITTQIEEIKKKKLDKQISLIDDLKNQRLYITNSITEIQQTIADINFQSQRQTKLRNEFFMASTKSKRSQIATQLLDKVEFHTCPKCHEKITKSRNSDDVCYLCKRAPDLTNSDLVDVDAELLDRIKELDNSLQQFEEDKSELTKRLDVFQKEKQEIEFDIDKYERENDSQFLTSASHLLSEYGIIKGRIETLSKLEIFPQKADEFFIEIQKLEKIIYDTKDHLTDARKKAENDLKNIDLLKKLFLDNLKRAKFPEINDEYEVEINSKNFIPILKLKNAGELSTIDFSNLSSGGKQTLFKTCYALAIHRLSEQTHNALPSLLIIDSPMKNIDPVEDVEIFKNLHNLIYELASTELKQMQIIIIGSNYTPPDPHLEIDITTRKMTRIPGIEPPLIPYYEGP